MQVTRNIDVANKFEVSIADIKAMVQQFMAITVPPEDTKAYKYARAALTTCVKTRTGIDGRRLDLGKEARNFIKDVNGVASELVALLAPAENHLRGELEAEDNRKAAIQAEIERIERERVERIKAAVTAIRALANPIRLRISTTEQLRTKLASLPEKPDEEFYQEFYQDAVDALEEVRLAITDARDTRERLDKEEADRKAEAERLEALRIESEAKQKELDEERAAFEARKKAAEDADAKQKEEDAAEAKRKQEEFEAKVAAEKEKADARKKELDDQAKKLAIEKARLAFEAEKKRLESEAKEKAEADAKAAEEKRKAKAKADADAKALLEKLRPDREKVTGYLDALVAVEIPEIVDLGIKSELATFVKLVHDHCADYKARLV